MGGILVSISILKRQSNSLVSLCDCTVKRIIFQKNFYLFYDRQVEFCSLIFQRIWRVLPVMAFVAFFQLTLFKFLVSGPLYREVDSQRYNCEQDIWKTLFFVSNYYRIMTGRVTVLIICFVCRRICQTNRKYLIQFEILFQVFGRIMVHECWHAAIHFSTIFTHFNEAQWEEICAHIGSCNRHRFFGNNWIGYSVKSYLNLLKSVQFMPIGSILWTKFVYNLFCRNEDTLYLATHHRFPAWLIGLNFGYFLHKNRDRKFAMPKVRLKCLERISIFSVLKH